MTDSNKVKTAAGVLSVIASGFSSVRGGTRLWLGTREDGKFVVASRFQHEIICSNQVKAERKFNSLVASAEVT